MLDEAIARIDRANAQDPNQVQTGDGLIAKELLYSKRMSLWLSRLEPGASAELEIACRAQHIQRWESPRTGFPEGRAGYKSWRADLLERHAEATSVLLREVGFAESAIERVASLIKKTGRTTDPESQTLEDVACLVFLEFEFDAFAAKHDDAKLVEIVRKTWKKMSERARSAAQSLPFSDRSEALVKAALA